MDSTSAPFVVLSHLVVPAPGTAALEDAFVDRLGEVDAFPGFSHLEVWRRSGAAGRYTMASWWDDPAAFRSYMRSEEHRRSHARIPGGANRPRPESVHRFEVIAR